MVVGFRNHCTQYLNYFEKFYDTNHELVGIYGQIKYFIDYMEDTYTEQNFINDLIRFIISYDEHANPTLHANIRKLVKDNYMVHLSYSNTKNPCLEYTDEHAEILMEISFIQNCIIPLIMHFVWSKQYDNIEIKNILLTCYDYIMQEIKRVYNIDIIAKLYETTMTNVQKSVNSNKVLWDMQDIRGRNPTSHSMNTIEDLIIQVFPKYTFNKNIVCFNYDAIGRELNIRLLMHLMNSRWHPYHLQKEMKITIVKLINLKHILLRLTNLWLYNPTSIVDIQWKRLNESMVLLMKERLYSICTNYLKKENQLRTNFNLTW